MINESQKKNIWKLLIITHKNDNNFYIKNLKKYDIDYDISNVKNDDNNYLRKVHFAVNYAKHNNFPYVMKCDNDLFIKAQTLDYMIDNLNLLENGKHLTIGPTLTSGIPCIEYFIDSFLDDDAKKEISQLFLKTTFYDIYEHLNKDTIYANEWNKDNFFNDVKLMNHYYKGIHPIRVNAESLNFLNNYIIKNKERFLKDNELDIIYDDKSPYLCNSIFCIKTDIYESIITNNTLYVDAFDEVPLNTYANNNNMNHLFVKNGYAIHMYYNWRPNHILSEIDFCTKFFYC
jgi:hypothetical protein